MSTKLGTLTLDLIAKIGNFTEPMKKAGETAQRESKRIETNVNLATKAIVGLGVTALASLTVGKVIESADAYTQMAARIRNVTKDTEEYNLVQGRLLTTANGTYRALSEAQEVYLATSGGLKELGYNTKQVLDISDSLSYSFVHNATSVDKAQSAMNAYGKVLDKGKVEADAWFSIIAAVPNVLDDVAKATGKSSQEVRKLGAEGKLAAEDLHKGFLLSRDANQALADAIENSKNDGMTSLLNGFDVLVGKANIATGATNTLAAGLATVGDVFVLASDNLDVLAVAGGTAATVLAIKMTPAIVMSGKAFVLSSIESAKYQVALARMAAQASGTTATLTVLTSVARGALSILGGPVGLILTVASVAASYALFRDNTKSSTVSLRENNESVEDAIKKYTELDQIKRASQLVEEREKLEDLSNSYKDLNSTLIAYTLDVGRHSDMNSEQSKAFAKLVMDYKQGKITLEQLSAVVSKSTALSGAEKDAFIKKASSVRDASTEMNKHKSLIGEIERVNKNLSSSHRDVTNAVNGQKSAYASLTEQQKKTLTNLQNDALRSKYIELNVARGMKREQAEYYADKKADAGIAYTEHMPLALLKEVDLGYKRQKQNEKREASEKQILETKKKQLEFQEKNYTYSKSEEAMLKRVAEINSKHGLNSIGSKYGIPENLLAAVMAQESKGNVNAKSPTGAIGPFQTTGIYRKQYNMSVADSYDVKKSAEVAAQDLAKSFEVFGNWKDAITAYNAGVGGVQNLNKNGFTGSSSKTKEAKEYAGLVDKWLVGLNGSSSKGSGLVNQDIAVSVKEWGKYWENLEELHKKTLDRQKTVSQTYFTEEERMKTDHEDALKEIQKAFAGDTSVIEKYTALQNAMYKKDVEAFKDAQRQKSITAFEAYQNPLSIMQGLGANATAQATLNPADFQKWQASNEQQAGYSELADSYLLAQQAINDNELIQDTEKYAELELLYESYLQNKTALSEMYAKQELDLAQQQKLEQFNLWGSVLNQAQNSFAQLTQSAKDSAGEQSNVYRTMFAMQQAFSIASSMAAAYTAYTQAFADPSAMTLPQKVAGGATVMAALMPAITTLSSLSINGMAHDGIDSIPKEGTWLLDRGERVVDSRTNADLKNYLSNQKQQAPVINIHNAPPGTTATQNSDGSIDIDLIERQLANRLGSANSVLSKSLKQNTTASRRR